MPRKANGRPDQLGEKLNNDALPTIELENPYGVSVRVLGTAPILFHRWSDEAVEAKAKAAKGSKAKKTDDIASYVYRMPDSDEIAIPGTYLYGTITDKQKGAAKYRQDPRSSRKSALDLYKAGIAVTTELASLGTTNWDYLDRRRAVVQGNGITRVRPALHAGWEAEFTLQVMLPEYIRPADLLETIGLAGRLVGFGDYRPTYGRFAVTRFELLSDETRLVAEFEVR